MTLEEYLDKLPGTEARRNFAKSVNSDIGYLAHVAKGRRRASATLAINIERESNGLVPCETTCPDADWEYIRTTIQKTNSAA